MADNKASLETMDPLPNKTSPFLEAAASAEAEEGDMENQRQPQQQSLEIDDDDADETADDAPPLLTISSLEKPLDPNNNTASIVMASNVGIFAGDDEGDTASVFSFDSYEKHPRIPLRIQNMLQQQQQNQNQHRNNNLEGSAVPFPSVVGASVEYENAVNVCPCRCLFFTLKETICLIMSALGCAVFMAGLIVLCMYLEGSLFNNSQN